MPSTAPELVAERKVFLEHLEEWRSVHLGEFVLIRGSEIIGFFRSLTEAFEKGTELYGLQPFFIQQIKPEDSVNVSFFGAQIVSP